MCGYTCDSLITRALYVRFPRAGRRKKEETYRCQEEATKVCSLPATKDEVWLRASVRASATSNAYGKCANKEAPEEVSNR